MRDENLPPYVDPDPKTDQIKIVEFYIVQIIPAPAGTFALFSEQDLPEGHYFKSPVPAWGLWDEWDVVTDKQQRVVRQSKRRRMSGPLVLQNGHLVPASENDRFSGVRYGSFVEANDSEWWDVTNDAYEIEKPSE